MKTIPGLLVTLMLFALAVLVIGAFSPALAQTPPAWAGAPALETPAPIWRQYTVTVPTDRDLYGLSMLDANEGWAVGGTNGAPAILHYLDGEWWDETPFNLPSSDLFSVFFVSPTLGWAVGDSGVILRYSSGVWQPDTTDGPINVPLNTVRMLSATEGWAAGGSGGFYRYSNGSWGPYVNLIGINNRVVNSLSLLGSSDAWAVGGANQFLGVPGLIAHYDGAAWTAQPSVAPKSLNSVAMLSPSAGWVVGDEGVTLRYNGSTWISQTNPLLALLDKPELRSVYALSATNAWAVGSEYPGAHAPTIMHWDDPAGAWVTDSVNILLAYAYPPVLHSVFMVSAEEGWAVGGEGMILRYSASTEPPSTRTPTPSQTATTTPTTIPASATATATASQPPLPSATATSTSVLPTATATATSALPTATATPTSLLPTATATPTSRLPTATATETVAIPTATATASPTTEAAATATATPSRTATSTLIPSTTATPSVTATTIPGALPDLVVLDVWTERTPGNCAGVAIKTTIKNQGSAPANAFVTGVYFQGGLVPGGLWFLDALLPGEVYTFTLAESAPGEGIRMTWVDFDDRVEESNEENNQLSHYFDIAAGCAPTATPSPTAMETATPSRTATASPSLAPTMTPTTVLSATATASASATATKTVASTRTQTPTPVLHHRLFLPVIVWNYPPAPTATSTPVYSPTPTLSPTPSCWPSVAGTFLAGNQPHGLAVAPGRLYIANHTGSGQPGSVSVVDSVTGASIVSPIAVGNAPNGAAYNPTNGMVYVANRDSNSVSVINTTSNAVVATIPVGTSPNGVAVNPTTNRIYVANYGSDTVTVINGETNGVLGAPVGAGREPSFIAVNTATNRIYVSNHGSSSITVIRGSDNAVVQTFTLPGSLDPYGIAVNPLTNRLYVVTISDGRLFTLNGDSGSILSISAPPGGTHLWMVAANPLTQHVIVTSSSGGSSGAFVYDTGSAIWLPGGLLPTGQTPEQGITLDATSGRVYIANAGSNNVTVIQDCR